MPPEGGDGGIPAAEYDLRVRGGGGAAGGGERVSRVAGGVFPGAVRYRDVPGRPLEVRSVWEYQGRAEEEGAYTQCFQGKLVLECHDDIPTAADGWGGGSWRDPVTASNCSQYEALGWCRGHVSSVLEPLAHPPAPTAGGTPDLMPTNDRFRAARVCCACGGGRTKVIYTQVKCVHVAVSADVAPELLVAAQVGFSLGFGV